MNLTKAPLIALLLLGSALAASPAALVPVGWALPATNPGVNVSKMNVPTGGAGQLTIANTGPGSVILVVRGATGREQIFRIKGGETKLYALPNGTSARLIDSTEVPTGGPQLASSGTYDWLPLP